MNRWVLGLGATFGLVLFAALISWAGSQVVSGRISRCFFGVPRIITFGGIFIHAWISQTELFFDLIGSVTFIGLMIVAVWFAVV